MKKAKTPKAVGAANSHPSMPGDSKACKRSQEVVDQASETVKTGLQASKLGRKFATSPTNCGMDTLAVTNVSQKLTYRALHDTFKEFGVVSRIRLVYEGDTDVNRCYVKFQDPGFARAALEGLENLEVTTSNSKAKLLNSSNVEDSDDDYCPNIFSTEGRGRRARKVPTPKWYVCFYRNGRGNFFHAARFLEKEIGRIKEGNIKKYGRGVLVRAKDNTQARMLSHLTCPSDSMFESVTPHKTFNTTKGCVYNYDLCELPEEKIFELCPDTVQKIIKIKGSKNMVMLTFYGSTLPVQVKLGPLTLPVRAFTERPLQCYLCYDYGHSKKYCAYRPRCGRCSAEDKHSTTECDREAFCFHCKEAHAPKGRECARYKYEQEIVHMANSQFISLGAARRELQFRRGKDGKVNTFASIAKLPPKKADSTKAAKTALNIEGGRFAALASENMDAAGAPQAEASNTEARQVVVTAEVHASENSPPRRANQKKRRIRGSSESLEVTLNHSSEITSKKEEPRSKKAVAPEAQKKERTAPESNEEAVQEEMETNPTLLTTPETNKDADDEEMETSPTPQSGEASVGNLTEAKKAEKEVSEEKEKTITIPKLIATAASKAQPPKDSGARVKTPITAPSANSRSKIKELRRKSPPPLVLKEPVGKGNVVKLK